MGRDVGDIPWPKRAPKQPKRSGSSGKGNGGTVGLAIALLAVPGAIGLWLIIFIAHGYNLI